jgi:hypothetical protein
MMVKTLVVAANRPLSCREPFREYGLMRAPALMLSALPLLATSAMAEDTELPVHACAAAVGTFLLRDAPKGGDTLNRSLIALTNGGHVMFVDSGERGEHGYPPFSNGLGRWRCLSKQGENPRLRAIILDFTFPMEGKQEIARLDLQGTVDLTSGKLTATTTLSFFPLDSDPFSAQVPAGAQQFTVTGQKIIVPH